MKVHVLRPGVTSFGYATVTNESSCDNRRFKPCNSSLYGMTKTSEGQLQKQLLTIVVGPASRMSTASTHYNVHGGLAKALMPVTQASVDSQHKK